MSRFWRWWPVSYQARHRRTVVPEQPTAEDQQRLDDARAAREEAEKVLREVQDRQPEVDNVVGQLRRLRLQNHIAPMLAESIRRRRA